MCIHPKKKKSFSALSRLQAFADAVLADGMKKGPNYKAKGRTLNYLKSIGIVRTINMNEQQFRKIK